MRTLNKNTTVLWYVTSTGVTDEVDNDGNYTGEKIPTYGIPVQINLNIYPYTGDVADVTFGKDASLDMVAVTNNLVFNETTLLFLTEPVGDYTITYDYSIDNIKKSINTTMYGLKRRV